MKRLLPLLLAFALSSDAGLMTKGIKNPAAAAVSGPWTTTKLASDFSTTSTTATLVTGLNTTVAANTKYEIDMWLALNSSTTAGLNLTISSDDATSTVNAVVVAGTTVSAVGTFNVTALSTNIGVQSTYSTGDTLTHVVGEFKTGASATLLQLNVLKVTSGTAIVRAGSKIHIRQQTATVANGWTTTKLLASDCTTTGSLFDCTGLDSVPGTAANYEWDVWAPINSSTTAGMAIGPMIGSFGQPGYVAVGGTTGGAAIVGGNINTDQASGNFSTSATDQFVHMFGVTTVTATTTLGVGISKTTSGTATLRAGTRISYRLQ